VTEIQPARRLVLPHLPELWAYRDLFVFLVWRDVKLRWAQTRLGASWLVLQPLAWLAVYTFAFSRIVHTKVGVPYPLYALAGMTAWLFISRAILAGAESLVSQLNVIKRTGCPRIIFPLAAIASGGIDFVVTIALYVVFAAAYGHLPSWRAFAVVPFLLLSAALATGFALLLSPAHARYRDVGRLLPFLVQLWFFVSPVAYSLPRIRSGARVIESFNPLVGLLSANRWALIGSRIEFSQFLLAIGLSIVTIVAGVLYFSYEQQTVADDL
jgi:lipopolysaccharide transport system permease protein